MQLKRQQKDRISRLFESLVRAQFADFRAGCAAELVVTCWGSTPTPTTLSRSDIADWYGSLQALSPTSLVSTVEVARVDGDSATVLLRHTFARNGVDYQLEMVNLLTLRDGLLVEWSSHPLDLPEYARAWRTHDFSVLAPA